MGGEVGFNLTVYAQVRLAEVHTMRKETMLKDRHIVVRTDMLPVQFVVVAQKEEAIAHIVPTVQPLYAVVGYACVHTVPCVDDVLARGLRRGIAENGVDECVGGYLSALKLLHKTTVRSLAISAKPQESVHSLLAEHGAKTGQAFGHVVLHKHTSHI